MIRLRLYDSKRTKRDNVESIIESCTQIFNETLGEIFFRDDNLKVAFCDSENRTSAYEEFCGQFFPLYLGEGYSRTDPFAAQAFTNMDEGIYGVLVCLDTDCDSNEWYQIILHELSHIFCIAHEIDGESFQYKYSKRNLGDSSEYWYIHIGYQVWCEFIANYITYQLNPFTRPLMLKKLREVVRECDTNVTRNNPDKVQYLSQLLQYIFLSPKIRAAGDADTVICLLEKNRIFATKARCEKYEGMINLIFEQLRRDPCWKIDSEFIMLLGVSYFLVIQ